MVFVQGMTITGKLVRPEIPVNAAVQTELLQDLGRMGCADSYHVTWDIDDLGIMKEAFFGTTPLQFNDNLVRDKPDLWEESC